MLSWWVGNGDLHLENLSLLSQRAGQPRLSPVYDLLSTRPHVPADDLALPVAGERKDLKPKSWTELAERCQLPPRATLGAIEKLLGVLPEALRTVELSFLPPEMKEAYANALSERAEGIHDLVEALRNSSGD